MTVVAELRKDPQGGVPVFKPQTGSLVGAHRAIDIQGAKRSEEDKHPVVGHARYNRLARLYDLYTAPMEWFGGTKRRARLLARAHGRVLEVGVGTGLNLKYYSPDVDLVGVDIAERMLKVAQRRTRHLRRAARLDVADIHSLPFADATFDTVTATCVFCSVADPVAGLREVRRVIKPGGHALLLEHVRPEGRVLGWLADRLTPFIQWLFGPAINRRTEENIVRAGLRIDHVRRKGIWREIVATPGLSEG